MLVVTFDAGETVLAYIQETGITWPVIIDERLELYNRYNMGRAGFWDLWGPATWWAYLKQLLKGNRPRSSSSDIHQRGGDVLIAPNGTVQLHHVGKGPADRPPAEELLRTIGNLQRQSREREDS